MHDIVKNCIIVYRDEVCDEVVVKVCDEVVVMKLLWWDCFKICDKKWDKEVAMNNYSSYYVVMWLKWSCESLLKFCHYNCCDEDVWEFVEDVSYNCCDEDVWEFVEDVSLNHDEVFVEVCNEWSITNSPIVNVCAEVLIKKCIIVCWNECLLGRFSKIFVECLWWIIC